MFEESDNNEFLFRFFIVTRASAFGTHEKSKKMIQTREELLVDADVLEQKSFFLIKLFFFVFYE